MKRFLLTLVCLFAAAARAGTYDLTVNSGSAAYVTGKTNEAVSSGTFKHSTLPLKTGTTNTLSFWFNRSGNPSGTQVMIGRSDIAYVAMQSSGSIYAEITTNGTPGSVTFFSTSTALADGSWHQCQLLLGPNRIEMLVDSVSQTNLAIPFVSTGGTADFFFRTFDFGGFVYDGLLDEVILTQTETNLAVWHFNGNLNDESAATAPTISNIRLAGGGPSSVVLTIDTPTAGLAPFTYQWFRDTAPTFTTNSGNLLSGQTWQSLTNTGLPADTWYYYRVAVNGADGQQVLSYSRPAQTLAAPISLGYIGDSIGVAWTANGTNAIIDRVARSLRALNKNRLVTTTNPSVNGSTSGQWIVGSGYLTTATNAFAGAGVQWVNVRLGMNDAQAGVSAATYKSNLRNTVTNLVALGYKVILNWPTYREPGSHTPTSPATIFDESTTAYLLSYHVAVDELCQELRLNVYRGDVTSYRVIAERGVELLYDRIHPNSEGAQIMADAELSVLMELLGEASRGPGSTLVFGAQ